MKRVAIFGSPGSGKSTLARQLSARTGLPVIHLDKHYFYPGWVTKSDAEFTPIITKLTAADQWITDGNYISNSTYRIERADTLILLDCPRWRCLWRVLWRLVRNYGRVRADQAAGCPERFHWEFLKFVWNFRAKTKRIYKILSGLSTHKTVYFLKNTAEIERFLSQVEAKCI